LFLCVIVPMDCVWCLCVWCRVCRLSDPRPTDTADAADTADTADTTDATGSSCSSALHTAPMYVKPSLSGPGTWDCQIANAQHVLLAVRDRRQALAWSARRP
jgi:hypothetical protein